MLSVSKKDLSGFDNIPCLILKHAAEYIVKPMTHLVNCSFIEGVVPSTLKQTIIKPILKKGDTHFF